MQELKDQIDGLFEVESSLLDTKKINNRAPEIVHAGEAFLDALASDGLTLEMIEALQAKGTPIFKYKTQLTVHGLFPDDVVTRVGGYKNVAINENGSMGIRYNAIDFDKKKRLMESLRAVDFKLQMRHDSHGIRFVAGSKEYEKIKDIFDRVDVDLFYGRKYMYKLSSYLLGTVYYVEIVPRAFREEAVWPIFTNWTGGLTEADVEAAKITNQEKAKATKEKADQAWAEKQNQVAHHVSVALGNIMSSFVNIREWDGTIEDGLQLVRPMRNQDKPGYVFIRFEKAKFGKWKQFEHRNAELVDQPVYPDVFRTLKEAEIQSRLQGERCFIFPAAKAEASKKEQPKAAPATVTTKPVVTIAGSITLNNGAADPAPAVKVEPVIPNNRMLPVPELVARANTEDAEVVSLTPEIMEAHTQNHPDTPAFTEDILPYPSTITTGKNDPMAAWMHLEDTPVVDTPAAPKVEDVEFEEVPGDTGPAPELVPKVEETKNDNDVLLDDLSPAPSRVEEGLQEDQTATAAGQTPPPPEPADAAGAPVARVVVMMPQAITPAQVKKEEPKVNQKQMAPAAAAPKAEIKLTFVDYSEKSFAVVGDTPEDTKQIKDLLKDNGGTFNRYLKYPAGHEKAGDKFEGWVFSKRRFEQLQTALSSSSTN
jgi:hypothetical protein